MKSELLFQILNNELYIVDLKEIIFFRRDRVIVMIFIFQSKKKINVRYGRYKFQIYCFNQLNNHLIQMR